MRWIVIASLLISWLFGATADPGYVKELKAYMTAKLFDIKGVMYTYDFNRDGFISYNEWVYESMVTGRTYRLLGTTPTSQNNFGFVPVDVNLSGYTPQGYFIFLDFPGDSKRIFSWAYLSASSGRVYKLMGATPQHHFDYLGLDDLTFTIENAKACIVYRYQDQENFPNIIGSYDTPGFSWSVDVRDSLAYVADGLKGVQILDISNPTAISYYAQIPSTNALKVTAGGPGVELLADEEEGLVVIDTQTMQKIGRYAIDEGHAADVVYDAKRGNAIVATDTAGVFVLHVNGSDITFVDHIDTISGIACKVLLQEDILYVADTAQGVRIYSVSGEGCATPLGTLTAPNIADFAIGTSHTYISYENSARIDVVTGFGEKRETVINDEPVSGLVLSPDKKRLYVLNEVASITVYELHNGIPTKVDKIYLPYPATDMKISPQGTIGYVTCGGDGLKVVKLR